MSEVSRATQADRAGYPREGEAAGGDKNDNEKSVEGG